MRSTNLLRAALVMLVGSTAVMRAQTVFPFQILVTTPTQSSIVANGGSVPFLAEIGQTATAHMIFTYQGSGTAVITQLPTRFGSTTFTIQFDGTPPTQNTPIRLGPGDSISEDVAYTPISALQVGATLSQAFVEELNTSSGQVNSANSITVNLIGTAPSFTFSYILQSDLNTVPLQPNGTLAFPATLLNTPAQADFNITNTGSGAGVINGIALVAGSSPAFKLQATPAFPAGLNSGQTLQVIVVYTPTAIENDTGQIQVTYGSGTTATFNLTGSGTSSSFTYQVIQSNGQSSTVQPGATITLPDTAIGSTGSVIVKVQNSGNANGTVNSVNISGQGFQLTSLSTTFPITLKANDSFNVSVSFTPTQPGPLTGQLAVGSDLFTLSGKGLGPQLGFSYSTSTGTIITINATTNTSVVFTPLPVTQSEQLTFVVTNTGTLQATVSNVSIGEANSPFSIPTPPASLPITIAPGNSFSFNVAFTPVTVGFAQGTLRVDANVVPLTGSGTAPPPLPSYTFQGPSGNVAAQSQPGVGLSLSTAYPVAVAGTLTLTTSGNLPPDRSVQFSTGLTTIPFVIPANATAANFTGVGTLAFLQTGTTAESIILTPSFTTQAGGVDITPASPPAMQLNVAAAAPTLVAAQIASSTSNGFALNVIGYSTTHTLKNLNLTFNAASGFNVASSQITVDLSGISPLWFQSPTALSFGGQFEITIPFTIQGTVTATQSLIQALASVSATVSNEVGTSNSMQASF